MRTGLKLAGGGIALLLLGLLVVTSGVVPVKASSGHWAITEAILKYTMRRSIATHAMGIDVPILENEQWIGRGAGHYETACRPCHGSPGHWYLPVPAAMTPPPPNLSVTVKHWSSAELFYIVKHGVKFTGMPAWPVQTRDDEVWAMVAFLLKIPGLDEQAYRNLVNGGTTPMQDVAYAAASADSIERLAEQRCARCHAAGGRGRADGAAPKLANQRRAYLEGSLRAYAAGSRSSGIMQTAVADLDESHLTALAGYYSALPAAETTTSPKPSLIPRGQELALRGIPERRIPSCIDCHGPGSEPKNERYPLLAGQDERYLMLQLELFRAGNRGGSAYSNLMHEFVDRLTTEDIASVAHYYASLR